MADIKLYKGGTPDISFMNCEGHEVTSRAPFGHLNKKHTPPFDAHYDGAYSVANFAAGFPFVPRFIPYVRDNLLYDRPDGVDVGDILQMIVVPTNHYIKSVRFDIGQPDPNMAGCTVIVTATGVVWDPTAKNGRGAFIWSEIPDITDAALAQGKDTPIDVSEPFSEVIWLDKNTSGYNEPLYVEPKFTTVGSGSGAIKVRHQSGAIILGVKIVSLPTAPGFGVHQALNDWWLTTRIEGFECPGGL